MPDSSLHTCDVLPDLTALHRDYLDPKVANIRLIQEAADVWLEVAFADSREPTRDNLGFIDDHDGPWFRPERPLAANRVRLLELDRMGLLYACPAMFTDDAVMRIQDEYEAESVAQACCCGGPRF